MCNLLLDDDFEFANNVLFIIGNGFDISHGIKSRYENFEEYLVSEEKNSLLFFLEFLFDNSGTSWSDLENTLGKYDPKTILDECRPDEDIDFDHFMRSTAAVEDSPFSILKPVLDDLRAEFAKWVNSISLDGIEQKFKKLSSSSLYLTFNYLETLENIYHIPESKVFHIHGSRIGHRDYIFGHNNFQKNQYLDNDDVPFYEAEGVVNIVNIMNELVKPYDENIKRCPLFQLNLQTIRKIVVVGHSLSESDWPYFKEIQKHIMPQVPWRISYHSVNDISLTEEKCHQLQICNYELFEV